jgi:hypothetical protein
MAPERRHKRELVLRGVGSMPIFYPPDRGGVLPLAFRVPVLRNPAADPGEPPQAAHSDRPEVLLVGSRTQKDRTTSNHGERLSWAAR